jgi:hypothetical protein
MQGAVPAPSTGLIQSERILSGSAGTISLRCFEIAHDFSDPFAVPGTGSCTITGGTGVYSNLQGHGSLAAVVDVVDGTSTDVLTLSTV